MNHFYIGPKNIFGQFLIEVFNDESIPLYTLLDATAEEIKLRFKEQQATDLWFHSDSLVLLMALSRDFPDLLKGVKKIYYLQKEKNKEDKEQSPSFCGFSGEIKKLSFPLSIEDIRRELSFSSSSIQ